MQAQCIQDGHSLDNWEIHRYWWIHILQFCPNCHDLRHQLRR